MRSTREDLRLESSWPNTYLHETIAAVFIRALEHLHPLFHDLCRIHHRVVQKRGTTAYNGPERDAREERGVERAEMVKGQGMVKKTKIAP